MLRNRLLQEPLLTSHPFKLILFDFDGTLVDSQANIHRCMVQAFTAQDLEAPSLEAVRRVVGLSLELAIAQLLKEEEGHQVERLARDYREAFFCLRRDPAYREELFPGALSVLEALDQPDVCLGIATGKNLRGLRAALKQHQLSDRFVTLQTPDHSPSKPHPGMVLRALSEIGCHPRETVLIGDTSYDMEMARNAGVSALGVAWGYHPEQELRAAGAQDVVESFEALPRALRGLLEEETCPAL